MKATLIHTRKFDIGEHKLWELDPPYEIGSAILREVVTSWICFGNHCSVFVADEKGIPQWPEFGGGPNMTHEQALATIGYQVDSKE